MIEVFTFYLYTTHTDRKELETQFPEKKVMYFNIFFSVIQMHITEFNILETKSS